MIVKHYKGSIQQFFLFRKTMMGIVIYTFLANALIQSDFRNWCNPWDRKPCPWYCQRYALTTELQESTLAHDTEGLQREVHLFIFPGHINIRHLWKKLKSQYYNKEILIGMINCDCCLCYLHFLSTMPMHCTLKNDRQLKKEICFVIKM